MKQSTRVMLNSAVSLAQRAIEIGLQFFLVAFILRQVRSEAYAVFLLAAGLETLLVLLRDSINKGCLVRVAHCIENGDDETINKVVSSAVGLLVIPAIAVMIGAAVAGRPVASFFGVGPQLQEAMVWIFLLAGLDVLLVLPLAPFTAVVAAHQRYDIVALVSIAARILRAGLIVVLFYAFGANVVFVMVGTVAGNLSYRLAMLFLARSLTPTLRVRLRFCDRRILLSLLAFGSFMVYGSLATVGATEASKWIIGKILSLESVTFLVIATYISAKARLVVQAMTLVLVPAASRFRARKNLRVLAEMLLRGTRYATSVSVGVMAVVLPVITPLLMLWIKPEMGWIGTYAVGIGVCAAIALPGDCAQQIFIGTGDSKRPFFAALAGGVITIATLVTTAGLLDWGFLGAIVAVCAGMLVKWAGQTFFALRSIHVHRMRFFWHAYLQPILAGIPAALLGWFLGRSFPVNTWLGLLGICVLSFITYVLCFLPFLTRQEWQLIRAAVRRLRRMYSA